MHYLSFLKFVWIMMNIGGSFEEKYWYQNRTVARQRTRDASLDSRRFTEVCNAKEVRMLSITYN
jgi:hypothetical protein